MELSTPGLISSLSLAWLTTTSVVFPLTIPL